MKKTLLLLVSVGIIIGASAQTDSVSSHWKTGGMVSINASQISFTNWAAGGQNSVAANSLVHLFANFKKNRTTWDNTLDLGYGKMRQGTNENVVWYKTDDKIDFSSKYGQYAFKHWYYSGLISFKSQFDEGYKNVTDTMRISNLFAPAYLSVSIGMDYKPTDNFTLFISPLSGKVTMVYDELLANAGAFGVKPGEYIRNEFGGYIKMQYKIDLMKNITYSTKLDLFSNYLVKPENIDVNWENLITMKINSWFSANIQYTMLYDDDVKVAWDSNDDGVNDRFGAKLQIKQLLGIGLTYKF